MTHFSSEFIPCLALQNHRACEIASAIASKFASDFSSKFVSQFASEIASKFASDFSSKFVSQSASEIACEIASDFSSKFVSEFASEFECYHCEVLRVCEEQTNFEPLIFLLGRFDASATGYIDSLCMKAALKR